MKKTTITLGSPRLTFYPAEQENGIGIWINPTHKTFGIEKSSGDTVIDFKILDAIKEIVEAAHEFENKLKAIADKY